MNKKLRGVTFSILAVLVLFNIGVFVFLFGTLKESESATLKIMRAKEIAAVSSNLSKRVYDAGVALGGLNITKSKLFSDRFDKLIQSIPVEVTELKDLIDQKEMRQFGALMKVAELLPDTIKFMGEVREQIMASNEPGFGKGTRQVFARMQMNAAAIQQSLQVLVDENKELANAKIPAHLTNFETINILLIINVVGNIIFGVAIAVLLKQAYSRSD